MCHSGHVCQIKITEVFYCTDWQNLSRFCLLLNTFQGREIQQQQHKFIVRKNLINYTVPQVAKTNLGRREEQLRVRV